MSPTLPPPPTLAHIRSSLASVLASTSPEPFKLIWASHPRWPQPPPSPSTPSARPTPGRVRTIACFDSSWNPPTNAHASLVRAPLPGAGDEPEGEYDAHLLLLSVKNVDKTLAKGDATFEQRLQMIHLLATSLIPDSDAPSPSSSRLVSSHRNLAIGILSEPAFVAKDVVVRRYLASTHQPTDARLDPAETRLAWLVGTDTLWRFFDQKYYPTPLLPTLLPFFSPPTSPTSSHPGSLLIHFPRLPCPPPPSSFDTSALAALPPGSVRDGRDRDETDWGAVSSSLVRSRIRKGEELVLADEGREGKLDLVSEEVREWLEREGLYRS